MAADNDMWTQTIKCEQYLQKNDYTEHDISIDHLPSMPINMLCLHACDRMQACATVLQVQEEAEDVCSAGQGQRTEVQSVCSEGEGEGEGGFGSGEGCSQKGARGQGKANQCKEGVP